MGVRRLFVWLVIGFALTGWYGAEAEQLKDVSASKFETRAPAKGYTFSSAERLADWDSDYSQQDIYLVRYDKENVSDQLMGILDRRGKKPKWMLQPHYKIIRDFGPNTLAAKRENDSDHNFCVLNLEDGICEDTDFQWVTDLTYEEYQTLPDWVGPNALRAATERENIMDLQLFTPEGRPLTIIRDAMFGWVMRNNFVKAYQLGDRLVVRTMSEAGDIRDAVLSRADDGTVSVAYAPPHAVLEMRDSHYRSTNGKVNLSAGPIETRDIVLMRSIDAGPGLVWPHYPEGEGIRPMPDGLLGLLPLTFGFEGNRQVSQRFGDQDAAPHFCCEVPLAWVALWSGDEGISYALMRQRTIPAYDTVLASRPAAQYAEFQPLWTAGTRSQRDAAIDEGQLIGHYAFHGANGQVEIYRGDPNEVMGAGPVVLEARVAAAAYPSWLDSAIRERAERAARADASYAALQAQKRAYKQAHEQALAEQRQRLARERQAAEDARQAERDAAAAAREASATPQRRMERIYGSWALARTGYCNTATWQTDLYAIANAKKACRDLGGDPGPTWVSGNGYEPFEIQTDQCYRAQAVSECYFN